MTESLPRVLVIASDTIGERMAGSGVRYWNLARVLGAQQPVTLATPNLATLTPPDGVSIVPYGGDGTSEDERGSELAAMIADHDVVVAQHLPYLYTDAEVLESRHLVVDLYAPWILEKLEYARLDPERGEPNRKDDVAILNRLLNFGDFFICASERQRDFWLGALAASGRLTLPNANADPALRALIDVVGFGLPEEPPVKTGDGLRGRFPTISADDPVLIWNGGLWNWLDPLTAIRSTAAALHHIPNLRLVFMGVRSPGSQVAEMGIVNEARNLSDELNLTDRHVFFNDWVPYEHRQDWLLEADVAISLHIETAEARFAYRTRILDTLWCGLPVIVTEGDVLADLVSDHGIGQAVPPSDPAAVATAIVELLQPDVLFDACARVGVLAREYTWHRVTEPLRRYCRDPWKLDENRGIARDAYLHDLERQYTETARYARRLEQAITEKDEQLARRPNLRGLIAGRLRRG